MAARSGTIGFMFVAETVVAEKTTRTRAAEKLALQYYRSIQLNKRQGRWAREKFHSLAGAFAKEKLN